MILKNIWKVKYEAQEIESELCAQVHFTAFISTMTLGKSLNLTFLTYDSTTVSTSVIL